MQKKEVEHFDADAYPDMLEAIWEDGAHIVHIRRPDENWYSAPTGGATVVWRRVSEFASGKMIEVSVSFCSKKDIFCRRVGSYNAIKNYLDGQNILLPIGHENSEVIVARIRHIFSPLL